MKKFRKPLLAVVLFAALFSAASCSRGLKPSADEVGPQPPVQGPDLPMGPLPAPDYQAPKSGYVLVLGPGLARSFSAIGVIEELEKAQIRLTGLVGVEIGAMIAAIYGSSSGNTLAWEMHKFRKKTYFDGPLIGFGAKVAPGKALVKFLEDAVKVDSLEKMRVPVVIVSGTETSGGDSDSIVEYAGSAREIVRGAVAIPGLMEPFSHNGASRVTAALENPVPIEAAKKLGLGGTICIDSLGRGSSTARAGKEEQEIAALMKSAAAIARPQLRECDFVVSVQAEDISYLDFDAKAEMVARGRKAALKTIAKILEANR